MCVSAHLPAPAPAPVCDSTDCHFSTPPFAPRYPAFVLQLLQEQAQDENLEYRLQLLEYLSTLGRLLSKRGAFPGKEVLLKMGLSEDIAERCVVPSEMTCVAS